MPRQPRILGLMSGTSADGVDVVLLELPNFPALGANTTLPALTSTIPRGRVLAHQYRPYPDDLRFAILQASELDDSVNPEIFSTNKIAQLHFGLGEFFAAAAKDLGKDADLISCHGQTVYHIPRQDPSRGWFRRATLQLGEAAVISEQTRKPVVADFRPHDMVAGGQAAPLVPFADRILFSQTGVTRAIHNLGGISNLTVLNGLSENVLAFDTGPANCLIDEAAAKLLLRFDEGGVLANMGMAEPGLIKIWAEDPYFFAPPPKSTGREYWSLSRLQGVFELKPYDIVASVTQFSANSIADAYKNFVLPQHQLLEIVVGGGGAYNPHLMQTMTQQLGVPVKTFEDMGWHDFGFTAQTREAAAFAVLGYYAFQGWTNTLPSATGASRAVVAGKLSRS